MLQSKEKLASDFRNDQMVTVRRAPEETTAFSSKEGRRGFATHVFGQLDTELVGLFGRNDIDAFDGGRNVGTSVPPRQKAVGRLD